MSKPGASQSLNDTRTKLRTTFVKKDCCTLVRPSNENEGLSDKTLSQLRPEFQANAKVLKQSVLTNQKPVSMNSVNLCGEQYFKLAESFVAALNENEGTMQYQSAWQSICANECEKAAKKALGVYEKILAKIKVPNENKVQLEEKFQDASEDALIVF